MAVVEQQVPCPSCDEVVDVTVADGKTILGTGRGHTDEADTINQLCTSCMDTIHVRVG